MRISTNTMECNDAYKIDTSFITLQLSQLGLTLQPFVNRQVNLGIYPTVDLQSQADFDTSLSDRTTYDKQNKYKNNNGDIMMNSSFKYKGNLQWPQKCYLSHDFGSFEEQKNQIKETRKRKRSELYAEEGTMENGTLSLRTKDFSTEKENEVVCSSNKRAKMLKIVPQNQSNDEKERVHHPRKRKLAEFMTDAQTDQTDQTNESTKEYKKRRVMSHHEVNLVDLKMPEALQPQDIKIDPTCGMQHNNFDHNKNKNKDHTINNKQ